MMRIKKTIILTLALLVCLCVSVNAASSVDFEKQGSVTVHMQYEAQAVSGGSLTLYHVADLVWNNGEYGYVPTAGFASFEDLFDLADARIAAELADYVEANASVGKTLTIDGEGTARFEDLSLGLYLIVQTEAAQGYYAISPFLVTVPGTEQELVIYDVDASPKVELEKEPEPTKPPITPDIPQTGQLQWPIPVLAFVGVLVFAVGWFLCFVKRKKNNET